MLSRLQASNSFFIVVSSSGNTYHFDCRSVRSIKYTIFSALVNPLRSWTTTAKRPQKLSPVNIVANHPYLGGTVPIFYAKLPTVPIFLDYVPIFLNSLNVQNSAILSPNLVILTIFNL